MIYLAVFNVCPPHSYETARVEGRVGRMRQNRGVRVAGGTAGDRGVGGGPGRGLPERLRLEF